MILKNVELRWAKLLGDPRENYNKDGREWSVDIILNDEQIEQLLTAGLYPDYIKEKDGVRMLKYKRPEFTKTGEPSKKIKVQDGEGIVWDEEKLIGNGSIADIQFILNELPPVARLPKRKKFALIALRIREHVPYEAKEGEFDEFEDKPTLVKEEWSEE